MNLRARPISTVAVLVSFWAWCALVCFPMIGSSGDLTEAPSAFASGGTVLMGQIAGLALFLVTIGLARFSHLISSIPRLSLAQVAVFLIIYLSLILQLHDDERAALTGIVYTCLLLVTALTLSVLWTLAPDDLEKCLSVASIVFCVFGISAIAILGFPQDRNIGSIQPNLFAAPLLAGFIFSQFREGVTGIAVRIVCFSMVALVSSRYAMIGCVSALVLFKLIDSPLGLRKISALIIVAVAGIVFWPQIVSLLAFDDLSRGVSSGVSGRDEYWHAALAAITDHPFGVGFKRAAAYESGHSGYLKTLVEFGILGGGLIIFLIGCVIAVAGIEAVRPSGRDRQQHRFACARFAGLVALAFGAFFQPQLLSLGDAFGISLVFLLFKPRMDPVVDRASVRSAHA
jgi:O-antigen ligase